MIPRTRDMRCVTGSPIKASSYLDLNDAAERGHMESTRALVLTTASLSRAMMLLTHRSFSQSTTCQLARVQNPDAQAQGAVVGYRTFPPTDW